MRALLLVSEKIGALVRERVTRVFEPPQPPPPPIYLDAIATAISAASSFQIAAAVLLLVIAAFIFRPPAMRRQVVERRKRSPLKAGSPLLASRLFVRDMARLAEHIVMHDVPDDFWSAEEATSPDCLQSKLRSRESAPFFAPDKVGDVVAKSEDEAGSCAVRWQRAMWAIAFKARYAPCLGDFVDTGIGTEKQAVVLLLRPKDQPLAVVVAFRGSKTLQDYLRTDISPHFVPVPLGALEVAEATEADPTVPPLPPSPNGAEIDVTASRFMGVFAGPYAPPCVTLGLWRAYAGEQESTMDGNTPRARVRRAVERLLVLYPEAQLVVCGHSLGGALSTLCAFDLLGHSAIVRAAGPATLVNFAAPRMFNQAFQNVMTAQERAGALFAMRVVVGSDVIARVPPRQLGGVHGVQARLLLHPPLGKATFTTDDPDDIELWQIGPADTHICHALYLGGETTPSHEQTVPRKAPWPYPPMNLRGHLAVRFSDIVVEASEYSRTKTARPAPGATLATTHPPRAGWNRMR